MKAFILKLICKFKGCNYPSAFFDNFSLSHCRRCGCEIAGRTFDDILPVPDDQVLTNPPETDGKWLGKRYE